MRLICEKCEKEFEAQGAALGVKVECPFCGDVQVVRLGQDGPLKGRAIEDRAGAAGYPPANGPEQVVLHLRPPMFRSHPLRFVGLCAAVVGGAVLAILVPGAGTIIGAIVAVAALGWLVVWKVLTLTEGLRITTKRTVDEQGILSKRTSEVLHDDIRNIQINQSFLQRVLGVGSIAISSAADSGQEIFMSAVKNPEQVKRVIDLYRSM